MVTSILATAAAGCSFDVAVQTALVDRTVEVTRVVEVAHEQPVKVVETVVVEKLTTVLIEREIPVTVEVIVTRVVAKPVEVYVVVTVTPTAAPDSSMVDATTVSNNSNSLIAYTSRHAGGFELYTVKPDGTDVTQLTKDSGSNHSPSWSPDGRKIAFSSNRNGDNEIFTMNYDGSNVEQLTANTFTDYYPAWSPDGNKIAFVSDRDGSPALFVMDVDGSDVTRLTLHSIILFALHGHRTANTSRSQSKVTQTIEASMTIPTYT